MTEDGAGYEIVTVREKASGGRGLGISHDSEPPGIRDVGDYGVGTDLEAPAYEEIKERIDLEAYEPGTEIARVDYDLDVWTYDVEYLVLPSDASAIERLLWRVRR